MKIFEFPNVYQLTYAQNNGGGTMSKEKLRKKNEKYYENKLVSKLISGDLIEKGNVELILNEKLNRRELYTRSDFMENTRLAFGLGAASTSKFQVEVYDPKNREEKGATYYFNSTAELGEIFIRKGIAAFPPGTVRGVNKRDNSFSKKISGLSKDNLRKFFKQEEKDIQFTYQKKNGDEVTRVFAPLDNTKRAVYQERYRRPGKIKNSAIFKVPLIESIEKPVDERIQKTRERVDQILEELSRSRTTKPTKATNITPEKTITKSPSFLKRTLTKPVPSPEKTAIKKPEEIPKKSTEKVVPKKSSEDVIKRLYTHTPIKKPENK